MTGMGEPSNQGGKVGRLGLKAPARTVGLVGRAVAGLTVWSMLFLASAGPQIAGLEEQLVLTAPSQFASFPSAIRHYDVKTQARPGPLPHVFRLPYPAEWMSRDGDAVRPLAVFIDGRPAAWRPEEPYFDQLDPQRLYAYLREAKSQSLFVVCPQNRGCEQVEIVRDTAASRLALAWSYGEVSRPLALRLCGEGLLFGVLAFLVARRLTPAFLAGLVVFQAAILFLGSWVGDKALALVGLVAIALLAAPTLSLVQLGIAWASRTCEPSRPLRVQAALFCLVAVASSWMGLRTIPDWYPADTDDTLFYVTAASRFLRTESLFDAALTLENWRYSAYPLALAGLSRTLGLHPIDAYPWASAIGTLALVSSAGALAWIATGRLTTALLTTWISGAWGGLGFWAWAIERIPAYFSSGTLRLLDTDFHEPRFLGEFTGPYSELTAYFSSAPFYPREAGLVPFWLALGLLYRRLQPSLKPPSLLAPCGLFLLSVAIYPYMGFAAVIALGIVALAEGAGDQAMRKRRRETLTAAVLVLLASGILGDLASRVYRRQSAWEWLGQFLNAAPLALAAAKPMPSLDFLASRMLGGQFFLALAFILAMGFAFRPPRSFSDPQRRAALISLGVCLLHGFASQASAYLYMLLFNFRWYLSWRALLTPITAMVAALLVESLVLKATRRPQVLLAGILLVPALSPLLWSFSVTDYLERERERATERGRMSGVWREYGGHGRSLLGRVLIPEPLAIEGAALGERSAAGAAFGIFVLEQDRLFANGGASLPANLGDPNGLNSVAVRREGASAARLRFDSCCRLLTSFGPYEVYVRKSDGTSEAP